MFRFGLVGMRSIAILSCMATDQIVTSRELLDEADREFETGDICAVYGRLWDAVDLLVAAELRRRGLDKSTLRSKM